MASIMPHLGTLALASAGFCIQAFLVPNVIVEAHRNAAGRVSADVSWRCTWNLVTLRRVHIDDFRGAEAESLESTRSVSESRRSVTTRLRLRSPRDSWLTQLMASSDAVSEAERQINAFVNCINCDAGNETVVIPGAIVFRVIGAALLLLGSTLFLVGVPLAVRRAMNRRRSSKA